MIGGVEVLVGLGEPTWRFRFKEGGIVDFAKSSISRAKEEAAEERGESLSPESSSCFTVKFLVWLVVVAWAEKA